MIKKTLEKSNCNLKRFLQREPTTQATGLIKSIPDQHRVLPNRQSLPLYLHVFQQHIIQIPTLQNSQAFNESLCKEVLDNISYNNQCQYTTEFIFALGEDINLKDWSF